MHWGDTRKQLGKKILHHFYMEILDKSNDALLLCKHQANSCPLPCLPKLIKEIQNENMIIVTK